MGRNRLKNDKVKQDRINRIIDLFVRGNRRADIVLLLSEEWQCSYTWVDRYIKFAKLQMKEQFESETQEDVNAKYDFLYKKVQAKGNDKLALEVLNSKEKLKEKVLRVDITSGGVSLKDLFGFK